MFSENGRNHVTAELYYANILYVYKNMGYKSMIYEYNLCSILVPIHFNLIIKNNNYLSIEFEISYNIIVLFFLSMRIYSIILYTIYMYHKCILCFMYVFTISVTVVDKLITVVVNTRGVISEFACTCKYCSFLLVIVNLLIVIQDCIYII